MMQASDWSKNDFARRLKRARSLKGLTQCDLADQLNTRQDSISRAEGRVVPREPLRSNMAAFVCEVESEKVDSNSELVQLVASSPELRALIQRIVIELDA